MPVRVVDRLEPVKVDEEHGQIGAPGTAAFHGRREPLPEQRPVRQPGQRIRLGLAADALEQQRLLHRQPTDIGEVLQEAVRPASRRRRPGHHEHADARLLAV